jgi:hypothetical protein
MYIHVANRWAGLTKTIDFGEKMQNGMQYRADVHEIDAAA